MTQSSILKGALWTVAILELGASIFFVMAVIYNWPNPMYANPAELTYMIAMCGSGFICVTLMILKMPRLAAAVALVQPLCLVWAQLAY